MKHKLKLIALALASSSLLVSLPITKANAEVQSNEYLTESTTKEAGTTGWVPEGQYWYYYINGVKQTGWIHPDSWYYLDNSGIMQTGWQQIDGIWYYFNEKGAMQTDWQQINGTWYYFNEKGAMQTDWQQINGKWYYFNSDGSMKSNAWVDSEDGTKSYYLKSDGSMAVSQVIDGKHYVDASGAWYYSNAQKVIDMACRQLGIPYVWGGTTTSGFDCSGLTQYCYRQALGIDITRTTYTQINQGYAVSRNQLRPGDLVFPHSGHVQLYIGDGKVIHAPQTGDVVKISNLPSNIYAARRIL